MKGPFTDSTEVAAETDATFDGKQPVDSGPECRASFSLLERTDAARFSRPRMLRCGWRYERAASLQEKLDQQVDQRQ